MSITELYIAGFCAVATVTFIWFFFTLRKITPVRCGSFLAWLIAMRFGIVAARKAWLVLTVEEMEILDYVVQEMLLVNGEVVIKGLMIIVIALIALYLVALALQKHAIKTGKMPIQGESLHDDSMNGGLH